MPRQYTYEEGYDEGYTQGADDGFDRGFTAGAESKSNEAERKVKEAVKEAVELIDLFYKMFPSVKDYDVALTETQRTIADKLIRVINIATFTERQRCLDIVEDAIDHKRNSELLNDIEQRIKGN